LIDSPTGASALKMICVSSFAVAALKDKDKSEVQSSHTPAENMVGGERSTMAFPRSRFLYALA
jgi:hypothetical protein